MCSSFYFNYTYLQELLSLSDLVGSDWCNQLYYRYSDCLLKDNRMVDAAHTQLDTTVQHLNVPVHLKRFI